MEQVFFNIPLSKLEPIFKRWIIEAQAEFKLAKTERQEPPEQLLSVQEAADFLNLTTPTIYTKVSRGELPVMKQGKRLYFSSVELMDYLKAGRKKSYAEVQTEADKYFNK